MQHPHPQSPDVINRLARIEGHVRAVKKMAEEGKPCADVLHQIAAVEAALRKVAHTVLKEHLDHCVIESAPDKSTQELVQSLKDVLSSYIR